MLISTQVDALIRLALDEDLGTGDRTTLATIPAEASAEARVLAKQALVLAGMPLFARVFHLLDPRVEVVALVDEGVEVEPQTVMAHVTGPTASLLTGERTALNILQRLCGVATESRRYARELEGTTTRVTDTRKTTPGMRQMQKYAARVGGAANHRFGLDSGVLIKDNHIAACGSIAAAVERARAAVPHLLRLEVEVATLDEVTQAVAAGADVIMLDNMSTELMRQAVQLIRAAPAPIIVEASGNMTLPRLREVAAVGVDFISVGALTHSAVAADISMKIPK